MKKVFLLSMAFMTVVSLFGQRISSFSIEGITSCGPSSAFNPSNNSETTIGDLQIVFPAGTDLSNVTPVFDCGTNASVVTTPIPTDFTSPVKKLKVEMSDHSSWALYDITCKVIKPVALPFSVFMTSPTTSSDSWTTSTEGWAAARIDKGQTIARFGGAKANLIVAFSDRPDSLYYSINAAGTLEATSIFDVEESADGINWTILEKFDANNAMPIGAATPAEKAKKCKLKSTTRYIRWFFNTRTSVNVTVQNISVTKSDETGITNIFAASTKVFVQNGSLNIVSNEIITGLEIFALNGQLLAKIDNPASQVNIADLLAGCYIVKLKNATGQTAVSRFIK